MLGLFGKKDEPSTPQYAHVKIHPAVDDGVKTGSQIGRAHV